MTETDKKETAIAKPAVSVLAGQGVAITTIEEAYRVATGYSRSSLVPEVFRGKPDDCFVAIELAMRLKKSPWAVMQSLYIVHGRPGFEGKFIIGLINDSGLFTDPLEFEVDGDDPFDEGYRVRAVATRIKTDKVLEGPWIDWRLVKAEGWDKKTGSKWLTMPGLMFLYRAASWFCNAYCPEVKHGMAEATELEDVGPRYVESQEIKGVAGVKETLKARKVNDKPVSSRGGESSTTAGLEPEPVKDQGRGGADDTRESIVQPPPAPLSTEEAEQRFPLTGQQGLDARAIEQEELFVCLMCKSKNRPCEYTAGQIADAAGKCPRCLTAKDLVPKSEAEDAPASPKKEPKATVRCLACKKEYPVKPAACECGSRLGFKKL